MTEKVQVLSTQIATPSQAILVPSQTISIQDVAPKLEPTVEGEEPYTIRCICGYSDDDGNTILCEHCDTWQHIDCYYPDQPAGSLDDYDHSCVICKPRRVDEKRAVERQRLRHSMPVVTKDAANVKPKRPPSKSHKKKAKPSDLQLNGHTSGSETPTKQAIAHDHPPPAKKTKTSHKSSQSISSHAAKRSPSYGAPRANHHAHPPSPATTPPDLPGDVEIHGYSERFLNLYKNREVAIVPTNSYAKLEISNTMSLWLRQPDRLRQDTSQEYNDVFQPLPADMDRPKQLLRVETKELVIAPEITVPLRFLATESEVDKDVPLMELNGQIGFQKDYCAEPVNQWDELSSPLPFVFFHPMLPLYIDTRHEGSQAAYVRRSCKPNATLDTFIAGSSEYQFWLVSDRHIAADEQVTIPWDFRFPKKNLSRTLHLLGLGDDDTNRHGAPDIDDAEYQSIAQWVRSLLSEYGGCACDLGSNCAFVRFHRNYFGKLQTRPNPPKKKTRKPKNQAISPTSTGHATNSRAASEGHMDDGPDQDENSSSRSKPPSRDLTPARQGSFDQLGILTQPTDRDKRKVAMVEDSFRRLEQQPSRKKKRVSDGTGNPSSSKSKSRHSVTHSTVTYVDVGTTRSKSESPASVGSPRLGQHANQITGQSDGMAFESRQMSIASHANYCDVGTQTDPVAGQWYSEPGRVSTPRRRIISLSKKLLNSRHRLRQDERKHREAALGHDVSVDAMDVDSSPSEHKPSLGSPTATTEAAKQSVLPNADDTPMMDASLPPSHIGNSSAILSPMATSPVSPAKNKPPDLKVQMPPVPTFNNSTSGISSATTPLSASLVVQSPFATSLSSPFGPPSVNGVATASPVKKKLSLSDYTKSRKAAASRPTVGTSLKSSTSGLEDPKSATSADGGAADSPTKEKATDGLPNSTVVAASTNGSA